MKLTLLLDKIIWLLTMFLLSSFLLFANETKARFFLFAITAVLGLFILLRYNFHPKITISVFHVLIGLFGVFCFFSVIWAIDKVHAIRRALTIFQILICMSVLWVHYSQKKSITPLLDCLRWAGYFVTIFAFFFYGWGGIRHALSQGLRLDNSFANVNAIAMFASFSILLTLHKWVYDKFSSVFWLALPEVVILAACGSRKGLVMTILGAFLIFIFKYASKNLLATLVKCIFIFLIGGMLMKGILSLEMFGGLNHRMEKMTNIITGEGKVDSSARVRMEMIRVGWQQFKQTPLLGIGMGNSFLLTEEAFNKNMTYLHNNYIDLLASGGIVGTCCFYLIFLYPFVCLIRYRHIPNINTSICLIMLFLLFTVIDFGCVSYYSKERYFYALMFYVQVYLLKKQQKNLPKEEISHDVA